MAAMLAFFCQLTGINFVTIYGNTLLKGLVEGLTEAQITFIVQLVNLTFTILGNLILNKFGRKSWLVLGSFA
jgi:hypothetical protein